jgi:tetratricopeptide (TPR) repeat protein
MEQGWSRVSGSSTQRVVFSNRSSIWLPVSIALLTAVVYAPVGGFDFLNFDDPEYVTANAEVLSGLDGESVRWAFVTLHDGNWFPLTWLSHLLDTELFGPVPGPRHWVNVGLHASSAVLLYAFLAAATGSPVCGFFVAALFALHPLNVQPVAWISQRKDVLAGLFFTAGLLAYARYARRPGPARHAGVVLACAAGLMSKPVMVTFPFLLLLLDVWPLGRWSVSRPVRLPPARLLLEKAPLVALVAVSSAVTLHAQSRGGAVASLEAAPLGLRLANAAVACVTYAARAVWPVDLAIHHPYDRALLDSAGSVGGVFACVVILAAVSAAALLRVRSHPFLAVGWLWYLGVLVPMVGIVQVGRAAWAERYAYLPTIGLFVAAVFGVAELARRHRRERLAAVVGVVVLAAFATVTRIELGHWSDTRAVFERALAVTGDNAVAHDQLAQVDRAEGRFDRAIDHWREAVRLEPSFWPYQNNLASALDQDGRIEEALAVYAALVRTAPGHAAIHMNHGIALSRARRFASAAAQFEAALRSDPGLWPARAGLADALTLGGRPDRALPHYRALAVEHPGEHAVQLGLANALAETGRTAEAVPAYRRALVLQPGDPVALSGLGATLLREGRSEEAIRALEEAVRRGPDLAFPRYNLALALESLGRRDAAAALLEAHLARFPGDGEARARLEALRAPPP